MDNNLISPENKVPLFKPNTFTPPVQNPGPSVAPATPPPTNPNPSSEILSRIKQHKKIILGVLGGLILIVVLIFGYQAIKNRFFPGTEPASLTGNQVAELNLPSSMQIKTSKNVFAINEKIPVFVTASSNGETVSGFDTVIEYDPEFLDLPENKPPPLSNFEYFSLNNYGLFRASAVLKPESTSNQVFDKTTLFDLEFTPKKAGKTVLKIIYMPNATNDSNLLNGESKDILGNAAGKEIIIN